MVSEKRKMNESPIEIIKELKNLTEKICEISCAHHQYAGSLSADLNKDIEAAIRKEFRTLYDLHVEKLIAATGVDLYVLQFKNAITTPQRRRRWYTFWKKTPNTAAKVIDSKISDEARNYYEELLARIESITGIMTPPDEEIDDANDTQAPPMGDDAAREIWEENHDVIVDKTVSNSPRR